MPSAFLDPIHVLVGPPPDYTGGLLGQFGTVGSFTPVDVSDHLPYITVRVGGGPRDPNSWSPSLSVQVFGPDRETTHDVAESVDEFLTTGRIWQFDRCDCISAPQEIHWADDKCRLMVAEYQLVIRRS